MASESKRKAPASDDSLGIEVRFIGHRGIAWEGHESPEQPHQLVEADDESQLSELPSEMFNSQTRPPTPEPQPSASNLAVPVEDTDENLKQEFIGYIRRRIRASTSSSDPDADYEEFDNNAKLARAANVTSFHRLLGVINDPTLSLAAINVERLNHIMQGWKVDKRKDAFDILFYQYIAAIETVIDIWTKQTANTDSIGRTKADRGAQADVPSWYGQCILSGTSKLVEGAHIIDVKATKKMGAEGDTTTLWIQLKNFWPIQAAQNANIRGNELRNVIPLRIDAHRFWDANAFAFRPIQHPTDPQRIFLQMVWLKNIENPDSLEIWDHQAFGSVVDFRRGSRFAGKVLYPQVEHLDVYELYTTDETRCPLPDIYFLRIRYAVQKLIAGAKAAGALKDIFGGEPPSDSGGLIRADNESKAYMPQDWDELLEAAKKQGILSSEAAERWRHCILEDAYEEAQSQARELAEFERQSKKAEGRHKQGGDGHGERG
ncbi:hypothetical protein B0T25DRAFT_553604 [Lasiosphaeria hispida]|uniref:HNH nuclease domain-containing protein n=1 Tax=Lasiosphaeria hispida TaxID=260671 RepID=A0AAJ0MBE8_9PEZI|nr:hypothetical protein B0T25DRAFT_553604 [Lasiosphaeria hispida]